MSEKKIESIVPNIEPNSTREGYTPNNSTTSPPAPPQNFVPAGDDSNRK